MLLINRVTSITSRVISSISTIKLYRLKSRCGDVFSWIIVEVRKVIKWTNRVRRREGKEGIGFAKRTLRC
jgi:hypothetical protein